jgi:hypothetical protein
MKKLKPTCLTVAVGILGLPLLACLVFIGLGVRRNLILGQTESAARGTLEATLAKIPLVPGDVLVLADSGVDVGGTDACVSYVFEQLHATDSMEADEVLDYYDHKLPSNGWKPSGTFYATGRGYSKSGNIHLSIYPVNQVYWYSLYPFGSRLFGSVKYPPPRPTLETIKKRFRTVFAFELATFPPEDIRCAR